MISSDSYNDLLLKYINLEAEIEIAYRHKLSKNIIQELTQERQPLKQNLNNIALIHQNYQV